MKIIPPFYPIVYVRGYAATMQEIEETSATPYMGFNMGSTKIRQDHEGKIIRFIFESPLIRLMKDESYIDTFRNGDYISEDEEVTAKSIWIFRYYERVSEELGEGKRLSIIQFAEDLRKFILRIKKQVCGTDGEALKNFKVYLVAHSMGGLVCRTYIQNICVNGTGDKEKDKQLELPGDSYIDKVFTYATPHNGIDVLGFNVPDLPFDKVDVRNFNREYMKEYLNLPKNVERVDTLNGTFHPDRFFCMVGTNHNDYGAFFGLSKKGTGTMSDGLVMISNAAVQSSPRAFTFRTHSGQYGIVNSEEGYQNLKRFLFGQVRIDAKLIVNEITLPVPIQQLKDDGKKIRASYYIETTGQVRGANYFLHERKVSQGSAILQGYDEMVKDQKPVYLFSGYLDKRSKTKNSRDTALAFAIRVAIQVPLYEVDNKFWFDNHFPGGYVIDETITFHLFYLDGKLNSIKYSLASESGMGQADKFPEIRKLDNDGIEITIPLGFKQGTANPPRPGFRGSLLLTATKWNE